MPQRMIGKENKVFLLKIIRVQDLDAILKIFRKTDCSNQYCGTCLINDSERFCTSDGYNRFVMKSISSQFKADCLTNSHPGTSKQECQWVVSRFVFQECVKEHCQSLIMGNGRFSLSIAMDHHIPSARAFNFFSDCCWHRKPLIDLVSYP